MENPPFDTTMKNLQPQTGPGQNIFFHFFIVLVIILFIIFFIYVFIHFFLSFYFSFFYHFLSFFYHFLSCFIIFHHFLSCFINSTTGSKNDKKMITNEKNEENCNFPFFGKCLHHWKQKWWTMKKNIKNMKKMKKKKKNEKKLKIKW